MGWVNGIEKILDSPSMKKAFLKLPLDKRFEFCRQFVMMPYAKTQTNSKCAV
jgi:hypothetical protein